ncbi:3D domain-containing protein [Aneurinibacillus terranovensis]|uniref:3D domain-containing protein n=1 Tax=Aneurinibacillus terranovensis TaxID=278991 RepID=UPI0003FF3603|nr:3D domain-containing protein [Aneurinibacillus terranovensis]
MSRGKKNIFNTRENGFKINLWSIGIGTSIASVFLIGHFISSLAETSHSSANRYALQTVSNEGTIPQFNGEVSAKELAPLGLASAQNHPAFLEISYKKKQKSTHRKKTSRSESRPVIREGSTFTARATAYAGPGKTYTGKSVRHGVVAVDPDVIPIGTTLWVEGYGTCRAEDIGSAITGVRLDLGFSSEDEANDWGVRDVSVKVLKMP